MESQAVYYDFYNILWLKFLLFEAEKCKIYCNTVIQE